MWSLQKDQVYGSDPEVFRPERWIDASEEKKAEIERQLDVIFGYGRWGCLGKPVAYLELNKIFVEVSIPNFPRPMRKRYARAAGLCRQSH
jgi:cytochrome P450